MIGNGVLHARIFPEIRRDSHIGTIRILLPGLLGVDALAVPGRACPCVPGEGLLHAKAVIGILRQLRLSVARLQDELRRRHRSKNAGLLLICSEQRADLLNDIRFRQVLQILRLQAGHFFFFDFFFFVFLGRHLFSGLRSRLSDSAVCGILQIDPACTRFQLSPAVLHLGNGKDAFACLSDYLAAHGALGADVEVIDDDGHKERHRRELCIRAASCGRRSRAPRGTAAELRCDLGSKVSHPGIHPVAGAAFVGKPAMDGQHHLIRLRTVVQRLVLIAKPDQLLLSVPLADIHAEGDQLLIHHIAESVRFRGIGGALDGDGPLVVRIAGTAPGAVLLLHIQSHTTILIDAVVGTCLRGAFRKPVSQSFRAALADHTVRRDAVDAVCPLPGVIRAQFLIGYQSAVRISHRFLPSPVSGIHSALWIYRFLSMTKS